MANTLFADRVYETSASTGTGSFTLNGAMTGYRSFSSAFSTNTAYYCIVNRSIPSEWEIGTFTVNSTTLARVAGNVLSGSAGAGTLTNFSAGAKDVFNILPSIATKNVASGVSSISAGTGLTTATITSTGTLSLANTAATAGSFGSASAIPTFTVNAQGRLTASGSTAIPTTVVTSVAVTGGLGNASYTLGAAIASNKLTISLNCNCNCCCACCCACCCSNCACGGGGGDDGG